MSSHLIAVFRSLPKELFRVNNGPHVRLRDWAPRRPIFDITSENGHVLPKALDPQSYKAPNGASLRPNSPYQQRLVRHIFRGDDMLVYAVPAGTVLPTDLVVVHERTDHYSLQPARRMAIDEFLQKRGQMYTREEWLRTFPRATEFSHP